MTFLEGRRDVDGVFDLAAMAVGFVCLGFLLFFCWGLGGHCILLSELWLCRCIESLVDTDVFAHLRF